MSRAAAQRTPVRLDASVLPSAKPAPSPGFMEPCRPVLREESPSNERWIHEIKFDGHRTQAHLRN
jgi:bifunctional non-homologous end joining protein LigD